jgi:predicted porin
MNSPQTHRASLAPLLAVLACASALSAQAQAPAAAPASTFTMYGLIDANVRHASNAITPSGADNTDLGDGIFTGSRWGLRGREDLGGGLRAFFTLEAGFDPSNGQITQTTTTTDYGQAAGTRFFGREATVGLGNAWGAVKAGRQFTVAHVISSGFQPQGNVNNTALSIFSSHHVARQDNLVRVDATLGDVQLIGGYTFGGQPADTSANATWALGAAYAKGDITVGGYVQSMNNVTDTETRKIYGLGGNYKITKDFVAFGGYMLRSAEVSLQENSVWTLGANYELTPQVQLSAQYLSDDQSGSAALDGSRTVGFVTANYKFSRRTDIYAVVDTNEVDGGYAKPAFMGTKGRQTAYSVGLRHRF